MCVQSGLLGLLENQHRKIPESIALEDFVRIILLQVILK